MVVEKLKYLRDQLGLTCDEFASEVVFSTSLVHQIEAYKRKPTNKFIKQVCKTFNIEENYFFDDDIAKEQINFTKSNQTIDICNRLKQLRIDNSINITKLALLLNINQSTISLIENNKVIPSKRTLKAYADHFNVSLDYLLTGDNQSKDYPINDEVVNFLKNEPEIRKSIYQMMKKRK